MSKTKTLTSANAVLMMTLPILPIPVQIKGFSADDMAEQEEIQYTESVKGVDGYMSSGYVNNNNVVNITLQPTSPSMDIFYTWIKTMKVKREAISVSLLTLSSEALGCTYICQNGVLTNGTEIPPFKKIIQPVKFKLTFESITQVPLA